MTKRPVWLLSLLYDRRLPRLGGRCLLGFPLKCYPKIMVRSHECSLCVSYVMYISYKNSLSFIVRKNTIQKPSGWCISAHIPSSWHNGREENKSHKDLSTPGHSILPGYSCAAVWVMLRRQRRELGTSARVSSRWEVA